MVSVEQFSEHGISVVDRPFDNGLEISSIYDCREQEHEFSSQQLNLWKISQPSHGRYSHVMELTRKIIYTWQRATVSLQLVDLQLTTFLILSYSHSHFHSRSISIFQVSLTRPLNKPFVYFYFSMSDSGEENPPPDVGGDDRPSENEDHLDDLDDNFDEPNRQGDADPVDGAESDDESLLSEVDEAQFADFDASAVQVAPDFDTLTRSIKVSKRKRVEGEEPEPKKRKEKTREKAKKNRRRHDSDDGFSGGEEVEGKRRRAGGASSGEKRSKPVRPEINEDDLTPEERRRRALDRAMDAAVKKSGSKRIRKGEIVSLWPADV